MIPSSPRPFRFGHLAALVLLSLYLGACTSSGPKNPPLQAQVVSEPPGLVVALAGKTLGVAPLDLELSDLEEAVGLTLLETDEARVVERRIQIQSANQVRVVLSVRDEPSDLAKTLGLESILVFDYGARASFEVDSYDISPDIVPLLRDQAGLLEDRFAGLTLFVCGHTDASGEDDHNRLLSVQRAQAVADVLSEHGVDAQRLTVQGFADDYPLAPNSTREGRALNRRTEIVLGE